MFTHSQPELRIYLHQNPCLKNVFLFLEPLGEARVTEKSCLSTLSPSYLKVNCIKNASIPEGCLAEYAQRSIRISKRCCINSSACRLYACCFLYQFEGSLELTRRHCEGQIAIRGRSQRTLQAGMKLWAHFGRSLQFFIYLEGSGSLEKLLLLCL